MNHCIRFIFLLLIIAVSCGRTDSPNKFSDPVQVQIADLKDRRSTDSLTSFFTHENPEYRKEAALAFGSVQDSAAAEKIGDLLLNDADAGVRKAAAFALGQTRCRKSNALLTEAISREQNPEVTQEILEAFGKVASPWSQLASPTDTLKEAGLAWSLYRAGLTGAVDPLQNGIGASLLSADHKENTRLGAAHFFARGAKNFENLFSVLAHSAVNDPAAEVRMAATLALRKIKSDSTLKTIERILKKEKDYRVRTNAVRVLQSFPLEQTTRLLFQALQDKNVNAGIASSEIILAGITEASWIEVANLVTDTKNWRIQASLYEAVVKVNDNKSILQEIKTRYQGSSNPYQKAALLSALGQRLSSYDFIENELLASSMPVIKSTAASALAGLNRKKDFDASFRKRFAETSAQAMTQGDPAVIGVLAGTLADSTLDYRSVISDFSFLRKAKDNLSLPKDNEALQPIEAALAYFEHRKISEVKNEFNHPIDWSLVKDIPRDQKVLIRTSKGNITLRLLVEEAPGSVANFVKLVRENYFDKKVFHRVVPNFVIQAGCNRGDGWGSEDYSIRSEFSQRKYKTGSVGMASAGKDTEGTQWFITHSPTPHLDGRYTIFAEVEKGMDTVDHIEVGDEILDIELIGNPEK